MAPTTTQRRTRLVAVGACAMDTILTVPYYPSEDSKLRATAMQKRRGGNTCNTLEVLQQLLGVDNVSTEGGQSRASQTDLCLIATLPSRTSPQTAFIESSFVRSESGGGLGVDMSHCVYREEFTEPVSSYILSTGSSRTIVNHNDLPEMTFEEFRSRADNLLAPGSASGTGTVDRIWFHFEGRLPETTLQCVRYLRDPHVQSPTRHIGISVELEKPGREGLQALAYEADFVFYSRGWAEGQGYANAEACLDAQRQLVRCHRPVASRVMICTWGAAGAAGLWCKPTNDAAIVHSPASKLGDKAVVDSTGAGDTFIAGVLYTLTRRNAGMSPVHNDADWDLKPVLDFANGLAGLKITRNGFDGLGPDAEDLKRALDARKSIVT